MKKVLGIGLAMALTLSLSWTAKAQAGGEVTIGVAVSMTGRYAEPAGRFVNSWILRGCGSWYVSKASKKQKHPITRKSASSALIR